MNITLQTTAIELDLSSIIISVFTGVLVVMWWVIRTWFTGLAEKLTGIQKSIDDLDEKLTEIDKRVTVNETKDQEIEKKVERLVDDRMKK